MRSFYLKNVFRFKLKVNNKKKKNIIFYLNILVIPDKLWSVKLYTYKFNIVNLKVKGRKNREENMISIHMKTIRHYEKIYNLYKKNWFT